jgi:acrylyl-CoA reductase (NADPH)
MAPLPRRAEAWARLARDLDLAKLDALTTEITLDGALDVCVPSGCTTVDQRLKEIQIENMSLNSASI